MLVLTTQRIRRLSIASSVVAILAASSADALDWQFAPRIELGGVYNDNYLMSTGVIPEREVSGGRGALALDVTARGQLTETRFVPEIRATYFPDDKDLDSTDKYVRFSWGRKGERSQINFPVYWSDQTIVEAETPAANTPDPILGNPSNVIGANRILAGNNRQAALTVDPNALFDLTERTRLDVRADYADVDYDNNVPGNSVDYRNAGGSLGVDFDLTPTSTLNVRGTYAQYDPDGAGFGSDGYGVEVTWRVSATERDQFYVMAGGQRTQFDEDDVVATAEADEETTFRAGIGAERQWTVTRMFVDAMYGVDPSATGSVVARSQLNFRLSRDFSQRTTGRVGVLLLSDEPVNDDISSVASREYASGLVGLDVRLSRQFSLAFEYTYTWEDYDDQLGNASSNAVVISLVYEPGRRN